MNDILNKAMRAVETQEQAEVALLDERRRVHGNWEDQAGTANTLKKSVRTPG